MLPVGVQVPVSGSYNSADAKNMTLPKLSRPRPPATRILPSRRRVVVNVLARAVPRLPVLLHVPVAGSYSSAEASTVVPSWRPPATKTLPAFGPDVRSVAVCVARGVAMAPVPRHVPTRPPWARAAPGGVAKTHERNERPTIVPD